MTLKMSLKQIFSQLNETQRKKKKFKNGNKIFY